MRFTIGRKIWLGFGVLIITMTSVFVMTYSTSSESLSAFEESKEKIDKVTQVSSPSRNEVVQLRMKLIETKSLITKWALVQTREDDQDKSKLIRIVNNEIPKIQQNILKLSVEWKQKERDIIDTVFQDMDVLFGFHEQIKGALSSFDKYEDPMALLIYRPMVLPSGEIDVITNRILFQLDDLIKRHTTNSQKALTSLNETSDNTFDALTFLRKLVLLLLITIPPIAIIVAYLTSRSIVNPVLKLKKILLQLGQGVFPENKMKPSNDEIGEMSHAMNQLVKGLKSTTNFANEIGQSNFDSTYEPLSEEDVLGHALLSMRDDLAVNERELEDKVKQRTAEVVRQKEELENQKLQIEELYTDVTDSIRYAKRLQESILPSDKFIKEALPQSFVLYKSKDIVSGDFYWMEKKADTVLFAAVDCTGHGVPGAFMSLVGRNGLNSAVNEHELLEPAKILNDLHSVAYQTLNSGDDESSIRDGMDIALCALNVKKKVVEFAGAYNPLYILRDGEILQTKGDKFPIGGRESTREFTNHRIEVKEGDTIYVFSDGYADQFGGERGKKFMYKRFREELLAIQGLPMDQQKEHLEKTITDWMGSHAQVDDILIIGVKI